METERLEGKLNNGVGRLESAAGEVLDDPELKATGEVRQLSGKAKEALANAAEQALDAAVKAKDQAGEAYDALRARAQTTADATDVFVKSRPYAALGLAALAGFVIGALMLSRGPKVIYIKPVRPGV